MEVNNSENPHEIYCSRNQCSGLRYSDKNIQLLMECDKITNG